MAPDPRITGEAAIPEKKAFLLLQCMGRGSHIPHLPHVIHIADLTTVKQRICAAEDEIHRSLDQALFIHLTGRGGGEQLCPVKALIPFNQIRRQGTGKEGILGG